MNSLQRWWSQLLAAWRGLSRPRRVAAIGLSVVGAVAIAAFAYLSANGDYRVLAGSLAPEEAGAITAKLQTQGVPFRLDAGGTSVLVPEERLAAVRVSLAADGIAAKGGKGFELFDDAPLGMTPFVQSVNYTRALQAELGRSIAQLEPVSSARVIIARADPSPFVRDQRPTTASVVLKVKPGVALGRAAATGIVGLVARSVEGLRPENVTVVDSTGRTLSDTRSAEEGGPAGGPIEYRRELETYLATKAEELLARHLGPGRAIVRVSADVNFQRIKERREQYLPEEKVVASERLVTSKSSAGGAAKGAAGAASNVVRASATNGGSGSNQEETVQTDYLVSKSVRELDDRLGAVTRLTVAAMVDLSAPAEGADGRPAVALADVQDLIKQAIGFRGGRDEIKVTDARLPSAIPAPDVEAEEDAILVQRLKRYAGVARNVAGVVAVIVTTITIGLLFWRRRRPTATVAAPIDDKPKNGHVNGHVNGHTNGGPVGLIRDEQRKQELDRLIDLARRDPDKVAELFESMLGGRA
jgi:flagellar M-ring protein FliF